MRTLAVIPARFASTRLPGKPLLNRTGKFLVQHVYEQVSQAHGVDAILVATDDARIEQAVRSFGGHVHMTAPEHPSGTDRIAQVVRELQKGERSVPGALAAAFDLVLNIQGDEPEIEPGNLDRLIERMKREPAMPMGTLACPFPPHEDPRNPNCVKVVLNCAGQALYFSRGVVPYDRDAGGCSSSVTYLLHLGVYAYRPDVLLKLARLSPTPLERCEKLEQLRALENGIGIAVEQVERTSTGIDTPEQYEQFVVRRRSADARSV